MQKWYMPAGVAAGNHGRMLINDTDRDGNYEFIFSDFAASQKIHIYELHLPNTWEIDSFPYLYSPLLWDMGDFDIDGLYDLVIQASATASYPTMVISIAESPDSFSYSTQEVWRDTVGFALVQPISVYDVDKDSFPEIFKLGWRKEDSITTYYPFGIYESVGDNQYDTIFMGTGLGSLSSTIAFGDFDSDGLTEFVIGNIDGKYQLWECIGNNNYQLLEQQQLPTVNIKDCFSVSDADGDGKLEFVVKGFVIPSAEIHAFIFEATGDNTYEIIKTFTLPGGDYYGGYSEAGDVDGDSIPEIVLEARQNVFIIKAADNDSFYIWDTLPGHTSGSCVQIFDIDENGLAEIVISGNNQTRIYEYDPGGIEEARSRKPEARYGLQVSPNPFKDKVNIRYQIPKGVDSRQNPVVSMNIYDVTGRLVRTLVNEPQEPGYYKVLWDGKDDLGKAVPSGIYFYRLEAGDFTAMRKMVVMR